MNMSFHKLSALTLAVLAATCSTSAISGEREDLEALRQTTLNLIQLLVKQGVLTQDKVEQLLQQAQVPAGEKAATDTAAPEAPAAPVTANAKPAEKGVVRVQYVPEAVKKQIADQVREEVIAQAKVERWGDVNAVPEWVDRIKIDGDIRVGYQADMFSSNNSAESNFQTSGQSVTNTKENRSRERMRARLGILAKVTPEITAGMRLATGSQGDPVSTNQTMGQTGAKYALNLDRAFLKVRSEETLPWLTTTAGRMPNPWFGTDLVWDDDLNFEGFAFQLERGQATSNTWRPFATVGAFPLQDIEKSASVKADSKWLYGAQAGVEWVPSDKTRAKVGLSYFDYQNIRGRANDFNQTTYNKTAPDFRQKGNTLFNIDNDGNVNTNLFALAADYKVLGLTGMVDLNLFNPVHVIFTGDYATNIGYDRAQVLASTGTDRDPQTNAYLARLAVGMPNMVLKGDWQMSLTYRYVEADSVVDAFTDSDFHLGGTNNKGFIVGGQYGLGKNTSINARWLSSNEINGLPLAINVFQLTFNARF